MSLLRAPVAAACGVLISFVSVVNGRKYNRVLAVSDKNLTLGPKALR